MSVTEDVGYEDLRKVEIVEEDDSQDHPGSTEIIEEDGN